MITIYTYNGQVLSESATGKWFTEKVVDPYNPLDLPPNTIRVRTSDGQPPIKGVVTSYETATLVPGTTDTYDVYKSGTNFSYIFEDSTNIVEVIAANTTNIIGMMEAFFGCTSLTTVSLFDTTSVSIAYRMFTGCTSLTSVPLFDLSNVTNMNSMFAGCYNVQTGALALYQQVSTQATPPANHTGAFRNCGRDTTTGAAELAQIPSDWK